MIHADTVAQVSLYFTYNQTSTSILHHYIMSTTTVLPPYNDQEATILVPSFSSLDFDLPSTLSVNSNDIEPLVVPSDLQAHLILLGAFRLLKEQVLSQQEVSYFVMEPHEHWSVFLCRAVYRFQLWIEKVISSKNRVTRHRGILPPEYCPPLDVVMVWLVYMLVCCFYIYSLLLASPNVISRTLVLTMKIA